MFGTTAKTSSQGGAFSLGFTPAAKTTVRIPYKPRKWAVGLHASFRRWAVLVLHRRAGKTSAVINHHIRAALDDKWEARRLKHLAPRLTEKDLRILLRDRNYAHIMPTYTQAKLVAWPLLRRYTRNIPGCVPNKSELSVTFKNGNKIQLFGADSPDSLRGAAFSGVSFDEYSQQPLEIFGEIISKALADHLGYAIWLGTLKGKDHLYTTYKAGEKDAEWYCVWQDIDQSLELEEGTTIDTLRQSMADDRKLVTKGVMTQGEFDQEWFLSVDAAIHGAFYEKELDVIKQSGRITEVPYDPSLPVDTDWDLGIADSMSIWFSQRPRGGQVRLIDFYQAEGEGIPHYAQVMKDRGYKYGQHWAPHDISHRELGEGKTRLETAANYGIRFNVCPSISVMDGIHAVRLLLARCYFDGTKCEAGLNALRHYRKRYNATMKEFTSSPVHDEYSHCADAFRTLAVRIQPQKDRDERKARMNPGADNPYHRRGGRTGTGWMKA